MRGRARMIMTMLAFCSVAEGRPQANVGVTAGVDVSSERSVRGSLGARGDVLFLRRKNSDWGIGPYAEVLSEFRGVEGGGGMSLLVPVHHVLPLVVSGGGAYRSGGIQSEGVLAGEVFWGSRSYNHSGSYVMAGGVFGEGRLGMGSGEKRLVVGLHVDGQVLALPFVLLYEWARGGHGR